MAVYYTTHVDGRLLLYGHVHFGII